MAARKLSRIQLGFLFGIKPRKDLFLRPSVAFTRAHSRNLAAVSQIRYQQESLQGKADQNSLSVKIASIEKEENAFWLLYSDGTENSVPYVWLRDNCQCPSCYDSMALARCSLVVDLDINIKPKKVEHEGSEIKITWTDSHISTFKSVWLYERAFTPYSIEQHNQLYRLDKETWGKDLKMDRFNYEEVMQDDTRMLAWLKTIERKGITLVQNCPENSDAGPMLIDKVAFVKPTHFGRSSPVKSREHVANLAYRSIKLGLHNDLPYYGYPPGIIFLHMVQQHEGEGGESVVSDGLLGVELFKKMNPEGYKLLNTYSIYHWDKGIGVVEGEQSEFHKIYKSPVIQLEPDGTLLSLRISSQSRESFMDVPSDKVFLYYEAMIQLTKLLYDNTFQYKLKNGEILILDNLRCQHGREAFSSSSSRHLQTSYLDWDEALCKRRCLQEKLEL